MTRFVVSAAFVVVIVCGNNVVLNIVKGSAIPRVAFADWWMQVSIHERAVFGSLVGGSCFIH